VEAADPMKSAVQVRSLCGAVEGYAGATED